MANIEQSVESADRRPGYKVVNYREVALPVFRVTPLVTLQAQTKIGPIEEFIFRVLKLQIDNPRDISFFLGLPEIVVHKQLGALAYENMVFANKEAGNRFTLTKKGLQRLRELSKSSIEKEVIPFYVDGITRNVVPVTRDSLYKNKDLEDMGIAPIPPIPRQTPRGNELDIIQMNSVLHVMSGDRSINKKVIKVDALVDKNYLFFRPAIALAFKSDNGRSMSIGFVIDGLLSQAHEDAFMKGDEARRSTIFADMFDPKKRRHDVQRVSRELQSDVLVAHGKNGVSPALKNDRPKLTLQGVVEPRSSDIEAEKVRTLSVYEHPTLLDKAITQAKDRLLIISPWIRGNVVNDDFLAKLTGCLERNVQVTIAFGIGREDNGATDRDVRALELLTRLSAKHKNFHLKRKGNTHAKVLVKDSDFFVTTSFNWLSFRGDPKQPFREEEGTYVTGIEVVDDYYQRLLARIEKN